MSLQKPFFKNISYLTKKNRDECLTALCLNPNGILIIEELFDYISDDNLVDLCANPYAIHIIEKNMNSINNIGNGTLSEFYYLKPVDAWKQLCRNRNAINLINKNLDKIDEFIENSNILEYLADNENPKIVPIIERYLDKYIEKEKLKYLCSNPNLINLIKLKIFNNENKFNINYFEYLCKNPNPDAINIIKDNLENFKSYKKPFSMFIDKCPIQSCWAKLFSNPYAIDIIKSNIEMLKIYDLWDNLIMNKNASDIIYNHIDEIINNPKAFMILTANPDYINIVKLHHEKINNWYHLCINIRAKDLIDEKIELFDEYTINNIFSTQPHLIDLIEKYYDKIYPSNDGLHYNPAAIHLISCFDYEKMKINMQKFNNELCQTVFHPKRVERIMEKYKIFHTDLDKIM